MARAPRRSRKEVILSNIESLEEKKAGYQKKIEEIEQQQEELQAELNGIEAAAAKAEEDKAMKEVLQIMKQKGLSPAELKAAIENN